MGGSVIGACIGVANSVATDEGASPAANSGKDLEFGEGPRTGGSVASDGESDMGASVCAIIGVGTFPGADVGI